jgi:hypothetical protein
MCLSVDIVVCYSFSCLSEYCDIYGIRSSQGRAAITGLLHPNGEMMSLAHPFVRDIFLFLGLLCFRIIFRRLLCRFVSLVVEEVLFGRGSCSVGHVRRPSMDGGVCTRVCGIREDVPIDNPAGARVTCLNIDDSNVEFDLCNCGD